MIIPLNYQTLYANIENDTIKKGSPAGDIILAQRQEDIDAFDIEDYRELPNVPELLEDVSLKSRKNPEGTSILGVYIFDKFMVNGTAIDCDSKFMFFIRSADDAALKKITLCCQATRTKEEYNVDNARVLECVSNYLGKQGFRIDAFEYLAEERVLNFIVDVFGTEAKTSMVFGTRKPQKIYLPFVDVNMDEWNDTEFICNCVNLLRRYGMKSVLSLLESKDYCTYQFELEDKAVLTKEKTSNGEYINDLMNILDKEFYVYSRWGKSRKLFWEWLLGKISQISTDVKTEAEETKVKGLPIPDTYSLNLKNTTIEINYKFSVEIGDDEEIIKGVSTEEEKNVKVSTKDEICSYDYKSYFEKRDIIRGDEVILTDGMISRLLAYELFLVKSLEEQAIILYKEKDFVNPSSEEYILSRIKEEN